MPQASAMAWPLRVMRRRQRSRHIIHRYARRADAATLLPGQPVMPPKGRIWPKYAARHAPRQRRCAAAIFATFLIAFDTAPAAPRAHTILP